MKTLKLTTLAALATLSTAYATPLKWTCDWPDARSQTFSLYHGETATFEPIFRVNGAFATNIDIEAVWYQTNGMANAWWRLDNATFAPTNDVGATAYRFFVAARDDGATLYRANGTLRMLPSPGYRPNALPPPVHTLDFAEVEVLNPPWVDGISENAASIAVNAERIVDVAAAATNHADSAAEAAYTRATNACVAAEYGKVHHEFEIVDEGLPGLKFGWHFYAMDRRLYHTDWWWRDGALAERVVVYEMPEWDGHDDPGVWICRIASKDHITAATNELARTLVTPDYAHEIMRVATNALAGALGDLAWEDEESDPTVASWAKEDNKPTYGYGEIVDAPTNVSAFANDAGYLTEHQSLADYATTGEVASVMGGLVTHVTDMGNPHHVTAAQTGAYVKPASGIPLADLHSALQTNIALAATAEQPETVRWSDDLNYNDNAGGLTGIWFRPRAFGMVDGAFLSVVTIHTATTMAIDKTVVLKIYDITGTTVYATSTPNRINAVNADVSFAFQTKVPLMRDTQYILRFCNAGSGAYETVRLNQRVIASPDLYFGETHSNWRPRVAVEWGYGIAAARAEIDGLKSGGNVTNMTVSGTLAFEDGFGGRIEVEQEELGMLSLKNAQGSKLMVSLPGYGVTDYAENVSSAKERIRSATNALAGALGDLAWKDDLTGLETDPVWLADKAGYQRRIPYCTCTSSADATVKVALPTGGATFTDANITTGAVVIVSFTNGNTYSEPWLQFGDYDDPNHTNQYKIRNRYGAGLFSTMECVCLVFNGTYWVPLHPLRAGTSARNRYGLVALSDAIGNTNTTDAATIAAVTRVDERLTAATNALAGVIETVATNLVEAIETHRATELWGEGGTNYVNAAGELYGFVLDPDSSYWMEGTNVFGYVGRTDTSFHPAYVGYEWRCSSYDYGGGIYETSLWYSPTAGTVYLGVSNKDLAPLYVGDQPTGLDPTVEGCALTNFVAQYDQRTFEFHPAAKGISDTPYDRYARDGEMSAVLTNLLLRIEALERGGQ